MKKSFVLIFSILMGIFRPFPMLTAAQDMTAVLGPQGHFTRAREAFQQAQKDLDWLFQYTKNEVNLNKKIRDAKGEVACARLDWAAFLKTGRSQPAFTPLSGKAMDIQALQKILAFLEKSRRRFFSGQDHTPWDTLLFLETRGLCWRLLGEQWLKQSDAVFEEALKQARNDGDAATEVLALYYLRRFEAAAKLADRLPSVQDLPKKKAVSTLRALYGALRFLGHTDRAGKVARALNALGAKAGETARPIFTVGRIFSGNRTELADAAGICATLAAAVTGDQRAQGLLKFMAGQCALGAGDHEYAAACLQKAQKIPLTGYLKVLVDGTAGVCQESLGDYEAALASFQAAQQLAGRLGNAQVAVRQMINAVSALSGLNRFAQARDRLKLSLKTVESPQEEIWIRLLLGNVKVALGREKPLLLGDAVTIYRRALERLDGFEKLADGPFLRTLLHINLGNALRELALRDDARRTAFFTEAITCAQRGLEAAQKAGRDRLALIAGANLAELYVDTGQWDNAARFGEWALSAARAVQYLESQWRAELYLGRIAEARKDFAAAGSHYRSAVDIVELHRRRFSAEAARTSFLYDKTAPYQALVRVLMASGKSAEAFSVAERARAKSALESLGLKALMETLGNDDAGIVTLARMLRQPVGRSKGRDGAYFAQPVSLQAVRDQLKALQKSHGMGADRKPALSFFFGEPTTAGMAARAIQPGETLVEYFSVGDRLALWIIDAQGVRSEFLPASWPDIREKAAAFASKKADDAPLAGALGRMLFSSFQKIPEKLLVIPTGILHRIPFEALNVGGKPLLMQAEIRYAPSAAFDVLLAHRSAPKGKGYFLGLANPDTDYNNDGKRDKLDLAFTLNEMKAIQAHYPDGRTFQDRQATESVFRRLVSGASVCHIACHGLFEGHDPWTSKLFLARDAGEDGHLHAWEVMGLDLRKASLITLSGCETGVVSGGPADDFMGLPRGFMLAGARTLVASLWPVEDRATAALMKALYKGLAQGLAPAGALRSAKMMLLTSKDKSLSAPRNWAAFVLFGRNIAVDKLEGQAHSVRPALSAQELARNPIR